jgi:dipeptidyl aminopeptidase/acylaminoacyl peptidase
MVNGIFPEQYTTDIFNNLEIIGQIKCDCMLIHSQDDDLIPVEHSKLLVKKFH